MVFDVAILGGGVVGTAIFNKLIRLGKSVILIEKENDVALGTSKANSGIVHAGFDAVPNTKKALLNVRGSSLMAKLCKELNVDYEVNGAFVIGNNLDALKTLYDRGIQNGVSGLEILNREKLLEFLPNINNNVTCGLYAKTSAIVSPYELTIALAEEGVINGGMVLLNTTIKKCEKVDDGFKLSDGKKFCTAKNIVLAVGSKHNEVAKVFGSQEYPITYRLGEYYLLEKNAMDIGGHTIFALPTKESKGVLISSTTSDNIIVGPTSTLTDSDSCVTTKEGLELVAKNSLAMLNNVNLKANIRVFSGVRTCVKDDFVIEKDKNVEGIINVTGICSPGLSASPAIAEEVAKILGFDPNKEIKVKSRPVHPKINKMTDEELDEIIAEDPRYGKIVCKCENISEKEIIDAINSPLSPVSLDAIKRRTRAGMGKCQGGFCFLKVMEIISYEKKVPLEEVVKEKNKSRIIVGEIK